MRTRTLTKTLNGIVSVVLASAAGASCGGDSTGTVKAASTASDAGTDAMVSPADEATFACDAPLAALTSNLQPVVPVDHIELRTQRFEPPGSVAPYDSDASVGSTLRDSKSGTECANASDKDACLAALETARRGDGKGWPAQWATGGPAPAYPVPVHFLVYTRGDEVGVIQTPEAVVSFLGQIDTLEEARLVLSTKSFPLTCVTEPFRTGWRRNDDGTWEMLTDADDCGEQARLLMKISPDGVVAQLNREVVKTSNCGRRTDGLVATPSGGAGVSIAAWLAEAAHLEAASVIAFRRLERELRRLGAPRCLLTEARRSRADEIRHAREMSALARRFGGEPAAVEVAIEAQRTPFAIALENAVEGCVRETYGALVAGYQARKATDPQLRSVLQRIARDEARHAVLAHDVACWLEPRLDAAERAAIARARAVASAELRVGASRAPASDVVLLAGMPEPRDARALLDLLETQVLSKAA